MCLYAPIDLHFDGAILTLPFPSVLVLVLIESKVWILNGAAQIEKVQWCNYISLQSLSGTRTPSTQVRRGNAIVAGAMRNSKSNFL